MTTNESRYKRQMLIGKIKKMWDVGYTTKEIAENLDIPESTARKIVAEFITDEEVKEILEEELG